LVRQRAPDTIVRVTGAVDAGLAARFADAHMTFTGELPDIRPTIANSTICVVPIRRGGGTRIKILQALALGTPVVTTNKGAEGLDVVDGQHLLLADEPEAFAGAVVRLLEDGRLREQLRERGRALIRSRYTWDASVAALDGILGRVAGSDR
jgi:polysaccharide biosynthesis protein PslH